MNFELLIQIDALTASFLLKRRSHNPEKHSAEYLTSRHRSSVLCHIIGIQHFPATCKIVLYHSAKILGGGLLVPLMNGIQAVAVAIPITKSKLDLICVSVSLLNLTLNGCVLVPLDADYLVLSLLISRTTWCCFDFLDDVHRIVQDAKKARMTYIYTYIFIYLCTYLYIAAILRAFNL